MMGRRSVAKRYTLKSKNLKPGEKFLGYGMRRMMMSIDMTSGKK